MRLYGFRGFLSGWVVIVTLAMVVGLLIGGTEYLMASKARIASFHGAKKQYPIDTTALEIYRSFDVVAHDDSTDDFVIHEVTLKGGNQLVIIGEDLPPPEQIEQMATLDKGVRITQSDGYTYGWSRNMPTITNCWRSFLISSECREGRAANPLLISIFIPGATFFLYPIIWIVVASYRYVFAKER